MRVGDTFLGALPGEIPHLWIIITPPNDQNEVVIVNLTSTQCDFSCRIAVDDHPFVKKPSVIRYQDARLRSLVHLESALKRGLIQPHHPVAGGLLKKIQQGALESEFTPNKVAECVRRWLTSQRERPS
jgi:hypothetical protein